MGAHALRETCNSRVRSDNALEELGIRAIGRRVFASFFATCRRTGLGADPATGAVMTISLIPGSRPEPSGSRPSHRSDELGKALRLAKQLCSRLSMPLEGEQAHGVRIRLVRAQALSVVDLLSDMTGDRTPIG
jgi:hypothetical protein